MGYDLSLVDQDGNVVQVSRHEEGGTYLIGGTTDASISITYNYATFFRNALDEELGIRYLYDRPAGECIERLESAIDVLGTEQDEDYWAKTQGNAGHILKILALWAEQHPNAEYIGD